MIRIAWQPPCRCSDCIVAGVSERERPVNPPDLHGRALKRWLAGYDEFREALARFGGAKAMPDSGKVLP